MSEPIRKPNEKSPESYSPKKPEIVAMAKQAQMADAAQRDAFIRKNTVELVGVDEPITLVGLSFAKCKRMGMPNINSPFDLYSRDGFALQERIVSAKHPQTSYGVWIKDKDVIIGKEVAGSCAQDELFESFSIPAGRYAKVSWNAETFSELVSDAMEKSRERSGVDAFLRDNRLAVPDDALFIEVYPHERMCVGRENGPEWAFTIEDVFITPPVTQYPEMFTLLTVKEENQP